MVTGVVQTDQCDVTIGASSGLSYMEGSVLLDYRMSHTSQEVRVGLCIFTVWKAPTQDSTDLHKGKLAHNVMVNSFFSKLSYFTL